VFIYEAVHRWYLVHTSPAYQILYFPPITLLKDCMSNVHIHNTCIKLSVPTKIESNCATDNGIHGNATECACNVYSWRVYGWLLCIIGHSENTWMEMCDLHIFIEVTDLCSKVCQLKDTDVGKVKWKWRKRVKMKIRIKRFPVEIYRAFTNTCMKYDGLGLDSFAPETPSEWCRYMCLCL
jgi:hypothetical protein